MSTGIPINLYLDDLDQSSALDTCGNFTATASTLAPSDPHAQVYYGAPVEVWAAAFKYSTDSDDLHAESTSIKTMQAKNLLCDNASNAAADNISVSVLYTASATTPPDDATTYTYTENQITDFSTDESANAPDAGMDFIKELCRHVFGSPNSVDLLDNEADVATSFGTALESCASSVDTVFATNSADETVDNAATSSSVNLKTASKLFNEIVAVDPERFTMGYRATLTGTGADCSGCPVTTTGSGTGANVSIYFDDGIIQNIVVNGTAGSGYQKGDNVTFVLSSGTVPNSGAAIATNGTVTISSLTSVQAAMLNSNMTDIEYPLIVGDCFKIRFVISNNPDQENIRGNLLNDTTVGGVDRNVVLFIKLQ